MKVGLAYNSNGELKPRRGSSLPIDVKCNISDIALKRVALVQTSGIQQTTSKGS